MKNTPLFYKSLALACALSCLSLSAFAITPEQAQEKLNEAQLLRNSDPSQATDIFEQLTNDTTLINQPQIIQEALESLAFMNVSNGDYDQALSYAEQLLDYGQTQNNQAVTVRAMLIQGYAQGRKSNFLTAEQHYRDALSIAKQIQDSMLIAQSYERLAAILRWQDKYIAALNEAQKSVNILHEFDDEKSYASALLNLGIIEAIIGDHNAALASLTQSFSLHQKLDDKKGIADSLYEIGEVYRRMGDSAQSLKHFKMSHVLDLEIGSKVDIGNSAMKVGYAALKQGELATATDYAEKSISYYQQSSSNTGLCRSYNLMALIALKQGNISEAQAYIDRALAIATDYNFRSHLVSLGITQTRIYQALDDHAEAIKTAEQALKQADELQDVEDQISLNKLLTDSYLALQLYKQAFESQSRYQTLEDNTGKNQHDLTVAAMQSQVAFMRNQQEINQLSADKQIQAAQLSESEWQFKAWLLGLSCVILLISGFGYRSFKKRKLASERAQLLQEVVDKKNRLLADVSHEIRTPLTALQLQVEALQYNIAKDVDASYDAINRKLTDINILIRDIHQLAQADSDSLYLNLKPYLLADVLSVWQQDFAAFVENKGFEFTSNIRVAADIKVTWDIDKIKQVLTNLLSNSTFYTDKPGKIKFVATASEQSISFSIEDTPPGVTNNQLVEIFERLYRVDKSRSRQTGGSGLGLAICKSLIETHKGTIKAEHSELGGVKILICLPLISEQQV
ncbi:tetratricopeptide repeat protein [Pseudoalteromonas sp. SYSU M81236]|jgi:signal transduction histidine kinase|uniref:tetratricopeptide repeat protein n=1 Tax=unclassified Pseudoalteromonas TaxID=194690 RepID=UPI001F46C51D|nr:tetratricopeptide repeat protein [Pseudoalteromonas sp. OFAV1]MCF2900562.1 tetratricopeptide repeat protein [Pseudoalteromonas sp. OFAV1]